jgi:hypothetical protein
VIAYFSRGRAYAFREMRLSVCGLEIIRINYDDETGLTSLYGEQKVVSNLTYQYEMGSGMDGSNSTFVLDSSNIAIDLYE